MSGIRCFRRCCRLLRSLRRTSEEQAVTPGSAWMLDVPARGEGAITVSDPQGKPVEAQMVASGRMTRLALAPARLPGVYVVKRGEAVIANAVVNVDARESDTRPIALESLKSGPGTAVTVARDEDELLLAGKTRQLWPMLAGMAAAMLGVEMLMLSIWRRPRKTSASARLQSAAATRLSSPKSELAEVNPQSAIREEVLR